MMLDFSKHTILRLAGLTACWLLAVPHAFASAPDEVFGPLTAHIQNQIRADKRSFLEAQACTEWFYKERYQKPPRPKVEGIAFRADRRASGEASDCRTRYPGGLDAAREDFSRTQSLLSISLTFYEFVLVSDRNDDRDYNSTELGDVLESFGLPFNAALAPSTHAATLTMTFDSVHRSGGLESLMTSMGKLYDKGYRLTSRDREALNKVMG